ncbi:MAG: hypothetical protein IJN09_05325 [Oscillospiraceae bacterium]|nr:hypothetical protein [Oscillospiraceae bacterium]
MNDNEIITAMECCASSTTSEACRRCPLGDTDVCVKDSNALLKSAIDLIKRKNAENEELKLRNQKLTSDLTSAKAEVEAFKESIREHAEMLAERDVQIRMLQKENEAFAPLGMLYSEIKSEARKEFAERLRAKGTSPELDEGKYYNDYDIDRTLAEMESERG